MLRLGYDFTGMHSWVDDWQTRHEHHERQKISDLREAEKVLLEVGKNAEDCRFTFEGGAGVNLAYKKRKLMIRSVVDTALPGSYHSMQPAFAVYNGGIDRFMYAFATAWEWNKEIFNRARHGTWGLNHAPTDTYRFLYDYAQELARRRNRRGG